MGDVQSIPVVGEIVTVVESGTKIVGAGLAAVVGETDIAEDLAREAGDSWVQYSERNIIAGTVNCVVQSAQGRDAEAARIAEKTLHSLEVCVDNAPVLGHAKGIVHYIAGDEIHGDKCMFNATRTTAVIGAGALTGGLGGGAVLGGVAGIETGLVCDLTATAVSKEPTGGVRALGNVVDSPGVDNVIDAGLIFAGDFSGGRSGVKYGKSMRSTLTRDS